MSKLRSQFIQLTDPFAFTGDVEILNAPTTGFQATNKDYVDTTVGNVVNAGIQSVALFQSEDLVYTDTVNKVIALAAQVGSFSKVAVIAIGGTSLDYGEDYTVRLVGTQAYICFSPSSTSPGAPFDGGDTQNPNPGLDGIILPNNEFTIMYGGSGVGGSPAGFQGPMGVQGASQFGGAQGYQGPIGTQGLTGAGVQGFVGSQGFIGFQGPIGIGLQGSDGPTGLTGPQGSTGNAGVQGNTGATGIQGALGSKGVQGFDGAVGVMGFQGFQGIVGSGVQGVVGPTGFQGFDGLTGPQGLFGSQGTNGPIGFQGNAGVQGNDGVQGLGVQGFQGANGTIGTQGFVGPQGRDGVQGVGVQGLTGTQGVTSSLAQQSVAQLLNTSNEATNTSLTDITFDTNSVLDGTDITHSTVSNTQNITINATGSYEIAYSLITDTQSILAARVLKNGTLIVDSVFDITAAGAGAEVAEKTFVADLTVGDVIKLRASASSAGNWLANLISFSIIRLGGVKGDQGVQGFSGAQGVFGPQGPFGGPQGMQGATGSAGFQGNQGPTSPLSVQSLIQSTHSVDQTGTTSFADLSFNTDIINIGGDISHDPSGVSVPNPRFTINTAGKYLIGFTLNTNSAFNGNAEVQAVKNGSTVIPQSYVSSAAAGATGTTSELSGVFAADFAASDYFTIQTDHTLAGTDITWLANKINIFVQRIAGMVGPQGVVGPQGNVGVQGNAGVQGVAGPQGFYGFQGNTGAGVQGATGFQGFTGSIGLQGSVGPQGFVGNQGVQGTLGGTGSTGVQGGTGSTGSTGPVGPQGNDGVQGVSGPQGFVGVQGMQGTTGSTGSTGATGVQGNTGANGPQGFFGYQGPAGSTQVGAIRNVSTSQTVLTSDYSILVDASSGPITITLLPAATPQLGQMFQVKKIDSSANAVTIKGNGSETIDGVNTQVFATQYEALLVQTNGTAYYIF